MDKNTLSNYGWIVIAVLVLSVMIALATPFGEYIKAGVESTTAGLFETSEKAMNVVGMSAKEEKQLTLSSISSIVLSNKGPEEDINVSRAGLLKYFYIPINSSATLNITNNSDEFKYSVIGFSDNLIYDYADSGWVQPKVTKSYTLASNEKYITINIARVDGGNVDISTIDLSDFIVTYNNDETNILDALLPMVKTYNKSRLKGYDYNKLLELSKKDIVAHACGTDIDANKSTMSALKNAVEVDKFKLIEVDVQETSDNILVCHHDGTLANTTISIRNSTYAELKNEKSDIASLEEILNYCGINNIGVVLDVKNIYSTTAISNMFSLIENNNLQDNFYFAGCPQYLLNNIPTKYKNTSYSVYFSWDDSYNGQNNIRCSNWCSYYIGFENITDVLKAGHKSFELFDADKNVSKKDSFKNCLSTFMYLCTVFDADYNLTLYNNISIPVLSEKEIINSMPKDLWDSLGVIYYN